MARKVKKTELSERLDALEQRVGPFAQMNWATTTDKLKELEAKIGRIESLERNHGFLATEIKSLNQHLLEIDRRLDNYKNRLTRVERRWPAIPKVVKENNVRKSS